MFSSASTWPLVQCQRSRVHYSYASESKIPERAEVGQLDHLAELGEIIDGGLSLIRMLANGARTTRIRMRLLLST